MASKSKPTKPRAQKMSRAHSAANNLGRALLESTFEDDRDEWGLMISAPSITLCLGLLVGIAAGGVKEDLCEKLGVDTTEELQSAFSELLGYFRDEEDGTIMGGSAAYFATDFKVSSEYRQHLALFDALVNTEHDNLGDATNEINDWVSRQTRGMINSIVSEQMMRDAYFILLNAFSFKGFWETQFDPEETVPSFPFQLANSKTREVKMMVQDSAEVLTAQGPGYTAACLPYKQTSDSAPSVSFVAYLPDPDKDVFDVLSVLSEGHENFRTVEYSRFGLPKFEMQNTLLPLQVLERLGYPVAKLATSIVHVTKITVDEEGTRAAAVTAVIRSRSLPKRRPELMFDRPFAFSIADQTGLALFTGIFSPVA